MREGKEAAKVDTAPKRPEFVILPIATMDHITQALSNVVFLTIGQVSGLIDEIRRTVKPYEEKK
jgi:hypothetical protein